MAVTDEASKILDEIASGGAEIAGTVQALVEKADVKARVREAVSENADQVQQKASHLAGLAKEVSKTTAETGLTAVRKVNVRHGRAATPYIAGGLVAVLVVWFAVRRRRRHPDRTS
ncbi:MAG TPA: hypothetical protein VFV02_04115 [Acidimicrobiales bacterium]|nr:hypothetical protein [Acidimicrobiales bacterium]